MSRRRYTDEERAQALAALAANGGNVKATAAKIGLPVKTLQNWSSGMVHPEVANLGQERKADLADAFESVARKLIGVADRGAERLNAKDAMIAAGVAVDKMTMLRGQS